MLKNINDPVYGFITFSDDIVMRIIDEPCFQRLRRIHQMGMSYLVFPGARHSRFEHAIGAMHLMQKTIEVLTSKGVDISPKEKQSLLLAILLHDIGHGPYSHALENSIIGLSHEYISLKIMERLNVKYEGQLDLSIEIFRGKYHRKFMNQLVSGQLDMDRLDYLLRDSFFSAVPEGCINTDRIISMLNVINDELVVEEKGIYPVESFLMARRFMYWQVYFHKVGLASEQLIIKTLERSREVYLQDKSVFDKSPLTYFLANKIQLENFDENALSIFEELDDYEVFGAVKIWQKSHDYVLSKLSRMLVNRNLLKIRISTTPITSDILEKHKIEVKQQLKIEDALVKYFVFSGIISNQAYNKGSENIKILTKSGEVKDILDLSDNSNLRALSSPVIKYYMSHYRAIN